MRGYADVASHQAMATNLVFTELAQVIVNLHRADTAWRRWFPSLALPNS